MQADRQALHFAGLVNAVLRRVARDGAAKLAARDTAVLDTPDWLLARWTATYGEETARAIAAANGHEPALDLTVKADAEAWAAKLHGRVLPTGSVRLDRARRGDRAAGLRRRRVVGAGRRRGAAGALARRRAGRRVADLCAAPGGKTAQLAAAGALVTAVDRAPARLDRLRQNLARLSLTAELVCADVAEWTADRQFDAVLLDAPCSSTGTIRRHPDVPWLKKPADIAALAGLQRRLIDRAVAATRAGGTLIYCTCSLEPEENERLVAELLARDRGLRRAPIASAEVFGRDEFIGTDGDLRTLPCQLADADSRFAGIDGFYAARLVKG